MNPGDDSGMFRAVEQAFLERWTKLDLGFWLSLPLAVLTVAIGSRFGVQHVESGLVSLPAAGAVGFAAFYGWRVVNDRLLDGSRGRSAPK